MSKPPVTITLGRSAKVVKRSWVASGTDSKVLSGRKRSLSERFEKDADTSMPSCSKRLQGKDNPRRPGSTGGTGVGQNDLRLKLMHQRISRGLNNDDKEGTRKKIRNSMSNTVQAPKISEHSINNGSPRNREGESLMMDPSRSYLSRPFSNLRPQSPDRVFHSLRRVLPPRSNNEERRVSLRKPIDASFGRLSNNDVFGPYVPIGSLPITRVVTVADKTLTEIPSGEQHFTVSSLLHSLGLGNFLAEEVDMTALGQMQDYDLKALGLPMGPRKKILLAIMPRPKRRK